MGASCSRAPQERNDREFSPILQPNPAREQRVDQVAAGVTKVEEERPAYRDVPQQEDVAAMSILDSKFKGKLQSHAVRAR